jgi:hypothetical protein
MLRCRGTLYIFFSAESLIVIFLFSLSLLFLYLIHLFDMVAVLQRMISFFVNPFFTIRRIDTSIMVNGHPRDFEWFLNRSIIFLFSAHSAPPQPLCAPHIRLRCTFHWLVYTHRSLFGHFDCLFQWLPMKGRQNSSTPMCVTISQRINMQLSDRWIHSLRPEFRSSCLIYDMYKFGTEKCLQIPVWRIVSNDVTSWSECLEIGSLWYPGSYQWLWNISTRTDSQHPNAI